MGGPNEEEVVGLAGSRRVTSRRFTNVSRAWLLALGVATAVLAPLAAPALASAAQTFAVTSQSPGGFPAGGHPTYTTTVGLDTSAGGPTSETVTLSPGVLASLAAAPNCLKPPANDTSACQVGTGSAVTTVGLPLSITAYLAPPPSPATDVAGIDLVTSAPGNPTTHAAVQLVQTASGNVSSVIKADLSSLGAVGQFLSSISLTINGTLANGHPFSRMPTNCSPGPSSVTVGYANGSKETSKASPDFAITGCSSLPYAPVLTASVLKDAGDLGVEVVTTVTQAADEAAGAGQVLRLPFPALAPNPGSISVQNTGIAVGTAVATSPLLPTPLTGQAFLTGNGPFTPTLTLQFPAPNKLTLVGTVDLNGHSVSFSGLPDVPQTSLVVTLFGGPHALQSSTCSPPSGTVTATFTGQNGAGASSSQTLTVSGCPKAPPPKTTPTATASLSGLASGKPALGLRLTSGAGGPKLKSFKVSLSGGLTLIAKKLARGVSIAGGHTLKLSGGTLSVSLKRAAGSIAMKIASSALSESKQLRQLARKHKSKLVKLRISITDAAGKTTTRTVSL